MCHRLYLIRTQVQPGQSMLIMGPSGAGKTSIMRALAGLWRVGSGAVRVHVSESDVMFLPQRPYSESPGTGGRIEGTWLEFAELEVSSLPGGAGPCHGGCCR